MNSYLFETYRNDKCPPIFMGYKKVKAESAEEARSFLQESLGEGFNLCQVYTNEADPYAR